MTIKNEAAFTNAEKQETMVWFGLVWFYGISTFVVYAKSIFIHIKFYFKQFSLV